MALVNLALPVDTNNVGFLGLADPTGNQWTLWRARNVGTSSLGGLAAATSDLGVVVAAPATGGGSGYAEIGAVSDNNNTIAPLATYQAQRAASLLYGFNGTNWQRLGADANGNVKMRQYGPDGLDLLPTAAAISDAASNPTTTAVDARLSLWNGVTWDRQRNNLEGTLLVSAARTTDTASAQQTNINARSVVVYCNVTAAGTGSPGLYVYNIDPASGAQWVLAGLALTGVGHFGIAIGLGAVASNQFQAVGAFPLGKTWQARVIPGDGSSWTYSVGYALID